MPRGGLRNPPGGRPKGSLNRASHLEPARGEDPLSYMLAVMNDISVDPIRRDRMAVAAAVYCHARVAADAPLGKKQRAELEAQTCHEGSSWERILAGRYEPAKPVQQDWATPYRWPGTEDE
jgi:hypothetical protein